MIRFATEKDRAALEKIGQRYSEETILGKLTNDQMTGIIDVCLLSGVVLLAERDNEVVGIIAGRFIDGFSMGLFFEEVLWYVNPEARGLGIMLFKRLLKTCEDKGCKGVSMWAYCNEHLEGVDKLYKRSGFKEIERKYYKTIGE